MKNIVIIGFGRMGISHATIISGILGPGEVMMTIVDPSLSSRVVARFLFPNARIINPRSFKRLIGQDNGFDCALLTTPPTDRQPFLDMLRDRQIALFVEKPVLSLLKPGEMSGYVLQHAPLNRTLKGILARKRIRRVKGSLITNLDFSSARGWRASRFGTVLHEFGGHVLSVIGAVCPGSGLFNTPLGSNHLAVRSAQKDHVAFDFASGGMDVAIELVAGSKRVRKASYSFDFETDDEVIEYDLYSIRERVSSEQLASVAESGASTSFYVRGFEFSRQMEALLSGEGDVLSPMQIYNFEEILAMVGN